MNKIFILILILFLFSACSSKVEKSTATGFEPPTLVKQPRLYYPKTAQENAIWGNTKLILSINKDGIVDDVYIVKSSGHDILDSTAINYCKNLLFKPAKRNGKPVNSKIEWVIKFNITDQNWKVDNYLLELSRLYEKVQRLDSEYRIEIEREILNKHNEFVQNFSDALNFNKILKQIISPQITKEWEKDWDGWPLSFLLYHDFMIRFSDYDSLPKVKTMMINSLKTDIQYIKNTPSLNVKMENEKEKILNKIRTFISKNYPEINLNELNLGFNFYSKFISKK
ncbi:MAG: energy transducer TonB [Melioribacter sp.]|uniref:energy transducer TonB n=1 Tax=Rosettibacter primus TaxID=3111523 RepID=UPI00247BCAAD|nr:energy transducer TonB [Melioribacter sp.]